MDHTNHVRLTSGELLADNIEGATIYGADDDEISTVDHVHGSGDQAQVVFDVGGFLGIGIEARCALRKSTGFHAR